MPPRLAAWLSTLQAPCRVLIPGCGSGYEAKAFADLGHDVLAIDFSDAAIEAARRFLGPVAYLKQADFFVFETAPFDLVYERAFLCALPRRMWPQWGGRLAELVRPGGALAGFFYFDDNERGPPFGISQERLAEILPGFSRTAHAALPPEESIPVFKGKEHWQVWKRRL